MKKFLRENGLSITWLGLFFGAFLLGQTLTGQRVYNDEQVAHGQEPVTYLEYLGTSHFVEATMENWESEFLQVFLFVALTAFLYQRGSAESRKLDEAEAVDRDPRKSRNKKAAPWPVRRGGVVLRLYEYSLSIAFMLLFTACLFLHAAGGARAFNEEQRAHGQPSDVGMLEYMGTSQFWFESLQNWQSEFLAVGLMVLLTIWLRQRGSPQSKPVDAPHHATGKD